MRALIQRVKSASVQVNEQICGSIEKGLLIFFGVHKEDTPDKALWLVKKIIGLRIFNNEEEKMHLDIQQVQGNILVVSQFTLYGNCSSGRRPDFIQAALPETAFLLYEVFVKELSDALGYPVQTGIFGAIMEVNIVNDGPVTFLLEK